MTLTKLPIENKSVFKLSEEMAARGFPTEVINCYFDMFGNLTKRCGLKTIAEIWNGDFISNEKINGIYYWIVKDMLLIITAKKLFTYRKGIGIVEYSSDIFEYKGRVSFAELGYYGGTNKPKIVMANGGKIIIFNGEDEPYEVTDIDAPTHVSYVECIDDYIVAIHSGTQEIHISSLREPENWDAYFFQANSYNDKAIALKKVRDELYIIGEKSTEVWYTTGNASIPFQRRPNLSFNRGSVAPHSLIFENNSLFMMDDSRHIVNIVERTPQIISLQIDEDLKKLSNPYDCVASSFAIGAHPFLMFSFEKDEKCFLYDYINKTWSEWKGYNSELGVNTIFSGRKIIYVSKWDLNIVEGQEEGAIYELDKDIFTDDDSLYKMSVKTAAIDYGISVIKRCNSIRLGLKKNTNRASGINEDEFLLIRWRDDGSYTWKATEQINLGKSDDDFYLIELRALGMYRKRQWELEYNGNGKFMVNSFEEDITGMSR